MKKSISTPVVDTLAMVIKELRNAGTFTRGQANILSKFCVVKPNEQIKLLDAKIKSAKTEKVSNREVAQNRADKLAKKITVRLSAITTQVEANKFFWKIAGDVPAIEMKMIQNLIATLPSKRLVKRLTTFFTKANLLSGRPLNKKVEAKPADKKVVAPVKSAATKKPLAVKFVADKNRKIFFTSEIL